MFSRSSAESAGLTSALSAPGCEPSRFASANPPRSIGSASIGQESQFTMTSQPSQALLFEDLSISSQADSHVSHSASPASKRAPKTNATYGLISHDSSAKSNPVGYLLRTYLASELSRLTSSSKTWKNSGTPHGRSWWALTTLAPRTEESGCSLWPAATAGDSRSSGAASYSTDTGRHAGTTLTDAANGLWASPQARDWKDSGATQGNRKSPNLGTQAHQWPTPKAADGRSKGTGGSPDHGLDAMARAGLLDQESRSTNGKRPDWPTPTAHDGRRPAPDTQGGNLSGDVVLSEWPTPRSNRFGAPDSHGKSPIRGSLNPQWVAQLMGFPVDWLDSPPPIVAKPSKPSETRSSRKSRRSSGE